LKRAPHEGAWRSGTECYRKSAHPAPATPVVACVPARQAARWRMCAGSTSPRCDACWWRQSTSVIPMRFQNRKRRAALRPTAYVRRVIAAAASVNNRVAIWTLYSKRIEHLEKRETVEIGIPRADSSDAVLAHENRDVASWSRLPASSGSSEITCSATSGCRSVGTRTDSPGEASKAATNSHAVRAAHGFRSTRGWVVTRRNS
jgi:hypothetical protein